MVNELGHPVVRGPKCAGDAGEIVALAVLVEVKSPLPALFGSSNGLEFWAGRKDLFEVLAGQLVRDSGTRETPEE